jgi:hypothetical protein
VKPANQLGSLILQSKTIGLGNLIIFVKAASMVLGRPHFIEALIDTNLRNPSIVRCSLFLIKLTAFLNRR